MSVLADLHALRDELGQLPPEELTALLRELPADDVERLLYTWEVWARPEQLQPAGDWDTWLCLAGRGWGKTRTGAEWVIDRAEERAGALLALLAANPRDARRVMIEGESGILGCASPRFYPEYNASLGILTWPNGSRAFVYSAETPDALRGPQHHHAWVDELCKFRYPQEAWDMLQFGLRLGAKPRVVITTTPKPIALLRQLMKDPMTRVTVGTTFDNQLNLPEAFFRKLRAKYEGTTLGAQELYARILDDAAGALWKREQLERLRWRPLNEDGTPRELPTFKRIVMGIDPAVTSTEDSDETGIIVAALGTDGHGYVWHDASGEGGLDRHARSAVLLARELKVDLVVGESNNGGDLVEHTLRTVRDPETDRPIGLHIPFKKITASRGKRVRAEPVAMLYQQGRVHHIGQLADLEDQMCTWDPNAETGDSPDRVDALVWALTELMVDPAPELRIRRIS